MDFSQHYTEDQHRFRREVIAWLEANLPSKDETPDEMPSSPRQTRAWRLRLAKKGWLTPTERADRGGADLTGDQAAVLLEELEQRGVRYLVDESSRLLRSIEQWQWGSERQAQHLLLAIASGQVICWRPRLDLDNPLDPAAFGIRAHRDGDDYVLNGQGHFAGNDNPPTHWWTLATIDALALPERAFAAFLVPAGSEGIRLRRTRLVAGKAHLVSFDSVRVPAFCLLGDQGDGLEVASSASLDEPVAQEHPLQDNLVDQLIQYTRDTHGDDDANGVGTLLAGQPVRRLRLMDAYIDSRIRRLFRARDTWMRANGIPLTYHAAQTRMWEHRAALRFSQISREVMGVYALLDRNDPRAPVQGDFELQQRQSLAGHNPLEAAESLTGIIATALRLEQPQEEPREKPNETGQPLRHSVTNIS